MSGVSPTPHALNRKPPSVTPMQQRAKGKYRANRKDNQPMQGSRFHLIIAMTIQFPSRNLQCLCFFPPLRKLKPKSASTPALFRRDLGHPWFSANSSEVIPKDWWHLVGPFKRSLVTSRKDSTAHSLYSYHSMSQPALTVVMGQFVCEYAFCN
ncbi:hypothetical protein GJAV_G00120350 [Gymnothorax javanicus]|nr:hypothetical protein GJAV_G00120350 [Gymnothorax javanicus]